MFTATFSAKIRVWPVGCNTTILDGLTSEQQDLVWRHLWLVDSIAERMGLDSSFVSSTGLETLCRVVRDHDVTKANFQTFASVCLKREFLCYLRTAWRMLQLEDHDAENLALDDVDKHRKLTTGQFGQNDLNILETLRSKLKPDDWQILQEYYVDCDTLRRIGERRGVNQNTIHDRVKKILAIAGCDDASSNRIVVALRRAKKREAD